MIMKRDPNKVCVLLVEDDESIRETMAMVLDAEGFEVHTAIDGNDALGQIAAAKTLPDLLITDLMMPNVTGWELVDVFHKLTRTSKIPIIVYSAVAQYNASNEVLKGCYFLRKPVELDLLMQRISEALGKRDTREASREEEHSPKPTNGFDYQGTRLVPEEGHTA